MSAAQFRTLNILGTLCVVLILGGLALDRLNNRLNLTLVANQNQFQPQFNEAQQKFNMLQGLAVRVAVSGQTNAGLRELLAKYDLQVTLPGGAAPKRTP